MSDNALYESWVKAGKPTTILNEREPEDLCFICEGTYTEHEKDCPCAEVREPKKAPTSAEEK